MRESRIRLLILYANYTSHLSYYDDWLDAIREWPGFDAIALDIIPSGARRKIKKALASVDAVVLLHSTNGDTTIHLERHASLLAARRVPLLTFVGNEVNLPGTSIAAKRRLFEQIHPEWIATQLLEEAGQYLFGDVAGRSVVSIPHALNTSAFRANADLLSRPIDIGTRVMRYSPHLGDNDRNRIADRFIALGRERKMSVDISNQRLNRQEWAEFLNRCKGTVSTEAGSWFVERDDATVNAIRRQASMQNSGVEIANDSLLLRLGYRVPKSLRQVAAKLFRAGGGRFEYERLADDVGAFDAIHAHFFAGKPHPPVYGKCISSRHFDAIGTKTCQIMFRGRFNDILEADRHYLALDDDFGNLNDVLRRLIDAAERRTVVDSAHTHVMEAHTYSHRMQRIEALFQQT